MNAEKQFYLDCLKKGKKRHDQVYSQMKRRFSTNGTVIRDILLEEGYIRKAGSITRSDGKKIHYYELTGKKFSYIPEPQKFTPTRWEDGSLKSQGNAFDWRNFSRGIFSRSEIAATESGRKLGVSTAGKQIPSRLTI